MKTRTANRKRNLNEGIFVMITTLILVSTGVAAQQQDSTQTLFKSNVKVSELWTPEIKINSIQGNIGTLIGFYGGALIDRTIPAWYFRGGKPWTSRELTTDISEGLLQYIHKPEKMIHFSGQMLIAYGTTKDYENPKSGLLDNFWNISGARFCMIEPGINLELNLGINLTLVTGISYRYVSGLNESDENVSITHVTNNDLSGVNFNIGLKFGRERKAKPEVNTGEKASCFLDPERGVLKISVFPSYIF